MTNILVFHLDAKHASEYEYYFSSITKGPFKKYVLNREREGSSDLTQNATVGEVGVLWFKTRQIQTLDIFTYFQNCTHGGREGS